MEKLSDMHVKKHLHLLIDLIALLLVIYMCYNKNDFIIKYWYTFVLSFILLIYANILWYMDKSVNLQLKIKIRRTYYAFGIFAYLFLLGMLDPKVVKLIGSNSFNISEKVLFTLYYFIAIILIDNLMISCRSLNEFAFGSANIKFETVAESIESQLNITDDLLDKVSAEHKSVQDIETFINHRIEPELIRAYNDAEYSIDIIKYIQEYLTLYFSLQEKEDIEVEALLPIEIKDSNNPRKIKNYYSLTASEVIETRLFKINNKGYLCIPYTSNLLLDDKIVIIMKSDKDLIRAEELIVKNLLSIFEYKLLIAMDNVEIQFEGEN